MYVIQMPYPSQIYNDEEQIIIKHHLNHLVKSGKLPDTIKHYYLFMTDPCLEIIKNDPILNQALYILNKRLNYPSFREPLSISHVINIIYQNVSSILMKKSQHIPISDMTTYKELSLKNFDDLAELKLITLISKELLAYKKEKDYLTDDLDLYNNITEMFTDKVSKELLNATEYYSDDDDTDTSVTLLKDAYKQEFGITLYYHLNNKPLKYITISELISELNNSSETSNSNYIGYTERIYINIQNDHNHIDNKNEILIL